MKLITAAIAAALLSSAAAAQQPGSSQLYNRDGSPRGSSYTSGTVTQYYNRDGSPAGSQRYSQPVPQAPSTWEELGSSKPTQPMSQSESDYIGRAFSRGRLE